MTSTTRPSNRYDVIVVGARCAGASTALNLARRGARVLVVDKAARGSDTLSTHALMRGATVQLSRWGVLDRIKAAGTPTIETTTFSLGGTSATVEIKSRDGVDGLYAPRRTVLDECLVQAAEEAGAEVRHKVDLTALRRGSSGAVRGVSLRDASGALQHLDADLVIGADGLRSRVARLVGARPYVTGKHTTAAIYGYFSGFQRRGYQWFYDIGCTAGVIPTNDGLANVFVGMPHEVFHAKGRKDLKRSFFQLLRQAAPKVASQLQLGDDYSCSAQVGSFRAFAGQVGFFRQSWGDGWALVGDAGYFKDPATAHGITDALRDAELLARAVAGGGNRSASLADYQACRDALSSEVLRITDRVASFEWSLAELDRLLRGLSKNMQHETATLQGLDELPLNELPGPLSQTG